MNRSKIVVGIGLGDEGKGRVVDYLCSKKENPIVVRFSGGNQAGHHVVIQNGMTYRSHVFSSFGSGTFRGAPTIWTHHCPINPIALENEYNVLVGKGVTPRLFLNPKSPIITPYDINWNRTLWGRNHGTCGMGIFAAMQREKSHYHLLVEDLYYPTAMKMKLEMIKNFYGSWSNEINLDDFIKACESIMLNKNIVMYNSMFSLLENYDPVFEGSQGLLLDQNIGFFPHVTPSNTGLKNAMEFLSEPPEIYLVTRAYQTRHGAGPMSPIVPNSILDNPHERNKDTGYQGKFRRTLLDLDLIRYAVEKDEYINNNETTLVIACMDLVESEHRLFSGGQIIQCSSEDEFVLKIKEAAKASKVMLSYSVCEDIYDGP